MVGVWMLIMIVIIYFSLLFTFGCVSSLSQHSTTWVPWTSAGCCWRNAEQQLHVQLLGSAAALLKQPLLFASALTVLGMEKSIMLFPCHQQVEFIYVWIWQKPRICCSESPVLKEAGMSIKCTWDWNLFILVGAFAALLTEKHAVWCYLTCLFRKLQFELWVYCLGVSKGRTWPRVCS